MTGKIHLYYGDGKGKTTAAAGLALRACGRGKKVLFVQFLKDNASGEITAIDNLLTNVTFLRGEPVVKFIFSMNKDELEYTKESQRELYFSALRELWHGHYDMAIFDELVDAVNAGFFSTSEIESFLGGRREDLEVVLTGHEPGDSLFDRCDYITEMRKIKHPFDKGQAARIGIEK